MIQTFSQNTLGTDYVVGDIHGNYHALITALRVNEFDEETDRLFCLGDLVDRGPYSEAVSLFLEQPWFHSVRGNHEQFCMDALLEDLEDDVRESLILTHQAHGGEWFYKLPRENQERLVELYKTMPLMIELSVGPYKVGLAHGNVNTCWELTKAGVASSVDDGDPAIMGLLWGRTRIRQRNAIPVKSVDHVFLGHTVVRQPTVLGNVHYIDTGAFHTGVLTMLNIQEYLDAFNN